MSQALPSPTPIVSLVERYGGTLDPGAGEELITAIAPIEHAQADELAPLLARRYVAVARTSPALLLTDASLAELIPPGRRWIHPHAAFVLARLLEELAPPSAKDARDHAFIDPEARVDPTAIIGHGVVIYAGAVIGEHTRIEPNAVIYGGSEIGARVIVGAGAVIGRPGFGWVSDPEGRIMRMPQLGGVRIEDDVELGPLVTIDAGTLGPTIIGRSAKLDAHVHVGHNASIGAFSLVAAQTGFAGSATIGQGALIGGQAGFADHVHVGAGARVAAKSGVIGDIKSGATVAGYPAVDRGRWLRAMARALAAPRASNETTQKNERSSKEPSVSERSPRSDSSRGPVSLDIHQVLAVLPHRYPFVMVDRVTEIISGKSIRGYKCVTFNEPWFQGHFPQRPIMPGVLILESLAQIGGILAYASDPFDPTSNLMFFLGIDKAKFRRTVMPGDRLDLYVEVLHHRSNVWKLRGEASVDGGLCAEGELLASLVDRQP